MFMYVPVLKGKQGELDALAGLTKHQRSLVGPLVELPSVPLKWGPEINQSAPAKSIDEHVRCIAPKLIAALAGFQRVYLDGFYLEGELDLENGVSASASLFQLLHDEGISVTPVVGLDRTDGYASAVRLFSRKSKRGVCLRLGLEELDTEPDHLAIQISKLLDYLRVTTSEVDLVLDYGPEAPSKSAMLHQINDLPFIDEWRTFAVTSSSFPKDMSDVDKHSVESLERAEWIAWNYLRTQTKRLRRMPLYGDYGINHPELTEIDPRVMRQSPNIRYTWTAAYVVAKGAGIPRKKDKLSEAQRVSLAPKVQYPKLSKLIMKHDSWMGKEFSKGDKFIEACARKECVGNPQSWRTVGMSHHFALVLKQLANLHEPELTA